MKNMILKSWIYKKIQGDAFVQGKTIVWDKKYDYDEKGNEIEVFKIKVFNIIGETEKALWCDCTYWRHGGRTLNFTEYAGYRVWIPKSAIVSMTEVNVAV